MPIVSQLTAICIHCVADWVTVEICGGRGEGVPQITREPHLPACVCMCQSVSLGRRNNHSASR